MSPLNLNLAPLPPRTAISPASTFGICDWLAEKKLICDWSAQWRAPTFVIGRGNRELRGL